MHQLTEFLFPAPARRTTGAILGWWERRRLPYNLIVGGAGVFSIASALLVRLLPPGGELLPLPPWQGIVAFGVLANVCYLAGPTVELIAEKVWGRELLPVGPALFRMGLTFSVGLALLPAMMIVLRIA